ncbi:MAG: proline--tRNA ligase, partial [Armatimonadota bacterium]
KMWIAFSRILARCGLEALVVEAESGAIGGKENEEYMILAEAGEDLVLRCASCGYAANAERCEIGERPAEKPRVEMQALELVDTPGQRTIEQVTEFLGKRPEDLVKTLIYKAGDEVVAALVRGDRELNEAKLKRALGAKHVEMADADTIERVTGAAVGFAGPVGLTDVRIVADREISSMANFVVGGNKTDTHYVNANLERDVKVSVWTDLRAASAGDPCPRCDGVLEGLRAIEAAHIFKLGTIYSEAMGAKFLDEDGVEKPFVMGCYGLGVSRILAAIPEVSNDADGMIWPISVAPFEVVILLLNPEDEDQCAAATRLYEELLDAGVDVLLDEREERPGVKFKDADLVGVPIQVVCGRLAAKAKVEVRARSSREKEPVALDQATERVLELRRSLYRALEEKADMFCPGRRAPN